VPSAMLQVSDMSQVSASCSLHPACTIAASMQISATGFKMYHCTKRYHCTTNLIRPLCMPFFCSQHNHTVKVLNFFIQKWCICRWRCRSRGSTPVPAAHPLQNQQACAVLVCLLLLSHSTHTHHLPAFEWLHTNIAQLLPDSANAACIG